MLTLSERIWNGLSFITFGLSTNSANAVHEGIAMLLPIILIPFIIIALIAIAALVFGICAHRNTKKILKKLEEKKDG